MANLESKIMNMLQEQVSQGAGGVRAEGRPKARPKAKKAGVRAKGKTVQKKAGVRAGVRAEGKPKAKPKSVARRGDAVKPRKKAGVRARGGLVEGYQGGAKAKYIKDGDKFVKVPKSAAKVKAGKQAAKESPWVNFLRRWSADNGMRYYDALRGVPGLDGRTASQTYRAGG